MKKHDDPITAMIYRYWGDYCGQYFRVDPDEGRSIKVWVVMGNFFPEIVFRTEAMAAAFCEEKRLEEGKERGDFIWWRFYELELR